MNRSEKVAGEPRPVFGPGDRWYRPSSPPSPIDYLDHEWAGCELQGYSSPGWYFFDELRFNCYGPYDTRTKASVALGEYVAALNRRAGVEG
jgi:hypothetical protein